MKRIITTLTITLFGFTATPTFANNWQWQTDQMATDSRCRDTNTAPAPAKSAPGK